MRNWQGVWLKLLVAIAEIMAILGDVAYNYCVVLGGFEVMQVTINLPEGLTEKIGDRWGNLEQKLLANLVLDALKEGLITFDELKKMLDFFSDGELKEFLREKNMLHSGGLLNLYGACPDLDLVEDDGRISDGMDDDSMGGF